MDKDDILVGKRFPRGKIFRRVLLSAEPLAKQEDHIQQPHSADGKGGQNLSERIYMQLTTDLYRFIYKIIVIILLIFLLVFVVVTYLNG